MSNNMDRRDRFDCDEEERECSHNRERNCFAEALEEAFNEGYKKGYCKGYEEGYEKGYCEGYKEGVRDGYEKAKEEILCLLKRKRCCCKCCKCHKRKFC